MDSSVYKMHPAVQSGRSGLLLSVVDGRLIKGNVKGFRKLSENRQPSQPESDLVMQLAE